MENDDVKVCFESSIRGEDVPFQTSVTAEGVTKNRQNKVAFKVVLVCTLYTCIGWGLQ
jgi:hypothetical protein